MSVRNTESAALDRAQLKKSFSAVPVGLKLLGGPIHPGNAAIFQMSINRSPRFGEYFQVWPGARDNEIEVLSADPSFLQLVLRVKEPRRRYVEVIRKGWRASLESVEAHARSSGGRVLKETRYDWRVEMWTPSANRRYLCGMDDLHLFIAQVRDGDTVAQAHESLKPDDVRRVESQAPGAVQRQGEWFFLPPSGEESDRIEQDLRERSRPVRRAAPVGAGAHPHVADLVIRIDRRTRSQHREYRRPEVYARGAVVHPDHRPLWLDGWRRVVRNREISGDTGQTRRIRWID
jgi:hypothetical protein